MVTWVGRVLLLLWIGWHIITTSVLVSSIWLAWIVRVRVERNATHSVMAAITAVRLGIRIVV